MQNRGQERAGGQKNVGVSTARALDLDMLVQRMTVVVIVVVFVIVGRLKTGYKAKLMYTQNTECLDIWGETSRS